MKRSNIIILITFLTLIGCEHSTSPTDKYAYGDCVWIVSGFYRGNSGMVIARTYDELKLSSYIKGNWIELRTDAKDVYKVTGNDNCTETK